MPGITSLYSPNPVCLLGKGRNEEGDEEAVFSTCVGLGNLGGWLLLLIGATFPCFYTIYFLILGEGGRHLLGLKNVNDIPE